MRIVAHRGNRLHAPENTRVALASGYTAGADMLSFELQVSKDGHLVVSNNLPVGTGAVSGLTLAELRKLDFSKTFQPRNSPDFRYYTNPARLLAVETFPAILESLPDDAEFLIQLKHEPTLPSKERDAFLRNALEAIERFHIATRTVVYARDTGTLREARRWAPQLRLASFAPELPGDEQLVLMVSAGADALITSLDDVLSAGNLTPFGQLLERAHRDGNLSLGAILSPMRPGGVFTEAEWLALSDRPFAWAIMTDSMLDVGFCRDGIALVDASFRGTAIDRDHFVFGYAKANCFGNVYQSDGVHLEIAEFPPFPRPPTDPLEQRFTAIETKLHYAARDWPYYSGGGLGVTGGIRGDFAAEVDYTVERVQQATMLEMAVVNVDPGSHQAKPPKSFRNKDSFFDPHGAPPFVGVEHDEDDGYRINWNLGSEYDSNRYGKPVGDGKTPRAGCLRLERRGSYFAAYYRNGIDAHDWVCCGVVRNDSMNSTVFLRCAGKRWRQENPANTDEYMPVIPNHFVFGNLKVLRLFATRNRELLTTASSV